MKKEYKEGDKVLIPGTVTGFSRNGLPHVTETTSNEWKGHYKPEELIPAPEFEQGEEVGVSDDSENWRQVTYVCSTGKWHYVIVKDHTAKQFIEGHNRGITITPYKYIRKLPKENKVELSLTINGETVNPVELSDESWMKLKGENQ